MNTLFRFFVSAICLFNYSDIDAQYVDFGVKGGISIPNLSDGGSNENPLNTGYSSRLGGDAAIFGDFRLSPVFSIQSMIEYSAQGGKKDGLQAFPGAQVAEMFPQGAPVPTYLYADFKSEAKLDYLLVPVLAKFGWNLKPKSPLRIYVDAGPFVGFLLSAKQVTTGSSMVYGDPGGQQPLSQNSESFDNTDDIKSQLHSANFGFEANAGLSYQMRHGKIFIEGGGNYGFLNIQKGTSNGKNHTGAGTLTAGYVFSFSKKK
jgi:hypothetical protein